MGYMLHTMIVYKVIAVNILPTLACRAIAARREGITKVNMMYKYITQEMA